MTQTDIEKFKADLWKLAVTAHERHQLEEICNLAIVGLSEHEHSSFAEWFEGATEQQQKNPCSAFYAGRALK